MHHKRYQEHLRARRRRGETARLVRQLCAPGVEHAPPLPVQACSHGRVLQDEERKEWNGLMPVNEEFLRHGRSRRNGLEGVSANPVREIATRH